ncbi:MAG TPA: hypothetical protein VI386_11470 [Candidatus Sulfotelmatobacter sp.]
MVGFDYTRDTVDSSETTTEWSIGLSTPLQLPSVEVEGQMVQSYGFRLYFLPVPGKDGKLAPNYWVTELKQHLKDAPGGEGQPDPDDIDGNSCAWKIAFIVDSYRLGDGTQYTYQP